MNALSKLTDQNKNGNYICVGLDTDINKMPASIKIKPDAVLEFNKRIIESTCEFAAAYKLNFAFYEREGSSGFESLLKVLEFIPKNVLTIADAKRGDIGNTSEMYAASVFDHFGFDSVTLHPYMGFDSLSPFIKYTEKLNFVLALTSNKGAQDFEKLKLSSGRFLFQEVIEKVKNWNEFENLGIVFGATNSAELNDNIELINDLPVLLPGIGAQGGSLKDVIYSFKKVSKKNFVINSSRGIIYKDTSDNFAKAAQEELLKLNKEIKEYLEN